MTGRDSAASTGVSSYRERNSTADRTLDVLDMFSDDAPVVSGGAVADRLGTSRSTAYRYLQSLVGRRYLEEAPGGGFRLGLRVLELSRLARRTYGLSEVALPVMQGLVADVGESVLLTRRVGDLVVCVERAEPIGHPVRISYERGSALPLNAGAAALVLLAWAEPGEARAVLERTHLTAFTDRTVIDVEVLLDRLAEIRRLGFSVTRGELDRDVVGVAAPVRDETGAVVAALSVAAVASRVPRGRETGVVRAARAAAAVISDRLAEVAG